MTVDQRQWAREAIRIIEADFQRSADTHLIPLETPGLPGVELYFKDESSHPTGSLKHRLARSLFLYALCNGWLGPAAPVIDPSNGSVIAGTAEAGATVILTDGGGNPIGQATADGSGNWTFTPGTPLANGTVINAVAQDPAGNTSGPASVTVDAIAPPAPVIDPSNGVVISGTAEAGATVILTDGNGNPIGQVTADGSGNWSFTPGTPLANGTVVNATASDPTGNTSAPASTTVDSVAPAAPVVNPSNGTTISGTAEAGAKVILTDGSGNPDRKSVV